MEEWRRWLCQGNAQVFPDGHHPYHRSIAGTGEGMALTRSTQFGRFPMEGDYDLRMAKQVYITQRILIGVVAILISAIVVYGWRQTYKGRLISTWIMECNSYRNNVVVRERARNEVRKMGVKVVPVVLNMMQVQDSPFRLHAIDWANKHLHTHLSNPIASEKHGAADEALSCLSPEARKVAVEELNPILHDTNHCDLAARALAIIGVEGIPHLNEALTDAHEPIRNAAAWALSRLPSNAWSQAEIAIPNLCANAVNTNQDFLIQNYATEALINIGMRPDLTIPTLLEAARNFRNSNPSGVLSVPSILAGVAQFGTNARVAIPVFVAALEDTNNYVRGAATNGIKRIDAEVARKMGVE